MPLNEKVPSRVPALLSVSSQVLVVFGPMTVFVPAVPTRFQAATPFPSKVSPLRTTSAGSMAKVLLAGLASDGDRIAWYSVNIHGRRCERAKVRSAERDVELARAAPRREDDARIPALVADIQVVAFHDGGGDGDRLRGGRAGEAKFVGDRYLDIIGAGGGIGVRVRRAVLACDRIRLPIAPIDAKGESRRLGSRRLAKGGQRESQRLAGNASVRSGDACPGIDGQRAVFKVTE